MAPTAPPIDGQVWLGCAPLTPEHWRGRVVVLVFWAGSCEASLLRVQQIQNLLAENNAPETNGGRDPDVVAIAVHSPRMAMDDDVDRLRHIVDRHRITIPVVHDPRFLTWNRYDPPGWPSTAVVDGNGKVTGITAGCRDIELVDAAIKAALAAPPKRRRRPTDDRQELDLDDAVRSAVDDPTARESSTHNKIAGQLILRYPEGISVADDGSIEPLLAIADSGHDRVLLGRLNSVNNQITITSQLSELDQPTQVAFLANGKQLAVVERGANVVSAVDTATGARTLIAENLLRPTGITVDHDGSLVLCDGAGDQLHRAMANSTQSGYLVSPIAGSGETGTAAGKANSASLAQPSAVVRSNIGLVFSDAASSNLRLLTDDGRVVNVTDNDMFDWGLVDGLAHRCRLQRPSALCLAGDGAILIADSGNNRLRRLHQRRVATLGLSGLATPSGLATLDDQRILVADTDNHRLVVVDTEGQSAYPIELVSIVDLEDQIEAKDYVSSGKTVEAT